MSYLLDYAQRKMLELGITNWEINTKLIEVLAGTSQYLPAKNDYTFFANAFTNGSNAISAQIIAENMAMKITPAINQTDFHKHTNFFTGEIKITNKDTVDTLYVELLVMTPKTY